MLLRFFETLARWFSRSSWLLKAAAIVCFAIPLVVAVVASDGPTELGALLALPGLGIVIWGITMCISWFHPERGSMRIDDEDTASSFRLISRSLSILFLTLYFVAGVVLAALPVVQA